MNKLISIILISAFSINASAGLCDIPKRIAKDEPAPCAGYIMSAATEEKIRTDLVYKESLIKNLEEAVVNQQIIIQMSYSQLDLYKGELEKQKKMSTFEKILYAGLGVAVGYGAAKVLQR